MIAHVIGASVLGYFVWDETAFLLLDIGFIWNIYLDGEMGLRPETLALSELRAAIDRDFFEEVTRPTPVPNPSPIESVEVFEHNDGRRLVLTCEEQNLVLETSFSTRDITIEHKE